MTLHNKLIDIPRVTKQVAGLVMLLACPIEIVGKGNPKTLQISKIALGVSENDIDLKIFIIIFLVINFKILMNRCFKLIILLLSHYNENWTNLLQPIHYLFKHMAWYWRQPKEKANHIGVEQNLRWEQK